MKCNPATTAFPSLKIKSEPLQVVTKYTSRNLDAKPLLVLNLKKNEAVLPQIYQKSFRNSKNKHEPNRASAFSLQARRLNSAV